MRTIALLVGLFAWAGSAAAEPVANPVSALAGAWRVTNATTGKIIADCGSPDQQFFAPTKDQRYVDLTVGDHRSRYVVLQVRDSDVLMFIEGEKRLTDNGDPVLWWARFVDPTRFYWRRYDWPPSGRTATEWTRCAES